MSVNDLRGDMTTRSVPARGPDTKLDVVGIPVSDVERAKHFSEIFHRGSNDEHLTGRDPQHRSYESLCFFTDPDGNGHADTDWPDWYADYLAREQSGQPPPT